MHDGKQLFTLETEIEIERAQIDRQRKKGERVPIFPLRAYPSDLTSFH
jgi:hypothetical protein